MEWHDCILLIDTNAIAQYGEITFNPPVDVYSTTVNGMMKIAA